MQDFSSTLTTTKSYINKPVINFETPNLTLNSKNYFAISPTHTRQKSMITCNIIKNMTKNSIVANNNNNKMKSLKIERYFDKQGNKLNDSFDNFFRDFKVAKKSINAGHDFTKSKPRLANQFK
jgi:hypothetical protein